MTTWEYFQNCSNMSIWKLIEDVQMQNHQWFKIYFHQFYALSRWEEFQAPVVTCTRPWTGTGSGAMMSWTRAARRDRQQWIRAGYVTGETCSYNIRPSHEKNTFLLYVELWQRVLLRLYHFCCMSGLPHLWPSSLSSWSFLFLFDDLPETKFWGHTGAISKDSKITNSMFVLIYLGCVLPFAAFRMLLYRHCCVFFLPIKVKLS